MDGPKPLPKPAIVGLEALTRVNGHANGHGGPARGGRPWKVAAIVPCFNRRQDLELLLVDVSKQDLRGIDLWLVVVDNASTQPLSTCKVPPSLRVEFVRIEKNSGGSGGFNAGMTQVLSGAGISGELGPADFLWWLDSDARVSSRCLRRMVDALETRPKLGAVGSALSDIPTGHTWEVGGAIKSSHGGVWPAAGGDVDRRFLVRADYLAACSALVRRSAVEQTGLFPDNFIYYDDVDWCIQMRAKTGLKVAGVPRSVAYHPPGNRRYVTWARYYIARNCFSHIDAMNMGGWVRFRRAWREVPRAVAQAMMGLPELSELHLRGLADARDKRFERHEPRELLPAIGFKPFTQLREVVDGERAAARAAGREGSLYVHPLLKSRIAGLEPFRKELRKLEFRWPRERGLWMRRSQEGHLLGDVIGAANRMLTGPSADVAIVPTGWPTNWFRGRTLIQVTTEGLLVRSPRVGPTIASALGVLWRGAKLAVQIGRRGPHVMPLPPAPAFRPAPRAASVPAAEPAHV